MIKKEPQKPDFILCDMDIQSRFIQMCQNFQKQQSFCKSPQTDWLIIDNETGEIIQNPNNSPNKSD